MKHLLTTVIRSFAVFFAGTMLCLSTVGQAAAEVRTISLYHVHTRESLTITYKKGETLSVERDEHPRPDTTMEALSRLATPFRKDGTVTAGNASGVNDGACALLLASEAGSFMTGSVITIDGGHLLAGG